MPSVLEILSNEKVNYYFLVSVSLLNIHNLIHLFEFLLPFEKNIMVNLVTWPAYLDVKHLPNELKNPLIEKLEVYKREKTDRWLFVSSHSKRNVSNVTAII